MMDRKLKYVQSRFLFFGQMFLIHKGNAQVIMPRMMKRLFSYTVITFKEIYHFITI